MYGVIYLGTKNIHIKYKKITENIKNNKNKTKKENI